LTILKIFVTAKSIYHVIEKSIENLIIVAIFLEVITQETPKRVSFILTVAQDIQ